MTIAINIPEELQSKVNQKLAEQGYTDVETFLIASLHNLVEEDDVDQVEAAWRYEITRRSEEIKNGTAITHSLEDVMQQARERINA